MFVIRGADGELIKDTSFGDSFDEPLKFKTKEAARAAKKQMQMMIPGGQLQIEEWQERCERCESDDDVLTIYVNDVPKTYCQNCRVELFAKKKPVGRPSLGVTKKVSLTLEESDWAYLDQKANGNRSGFIREVVWNALGNESAWDNYACLGYAIKGLERLEYSPEEIKKVIQAIYAEFDTTSVPVANEHYRKSDY